MGDIKDSLGVIGSGAIGAVGSVASSLISGSMARSNWREMAEYNSPANQVKRLRAAGINPALAMQQGMMESGNPSSPAETNPQFDLNQLAGSVRDSVALRQQGELNDANIKNINANTLSQNIRNLTQLQRDLADLNLTISKMKETDRNTDVLEKQAAYLSKQIEKYDDLVGSQIRSYNAGSEFHEEQAETERVMRDVNKKLAEEGIRLSKSQQGLLNAQVGQVNETVNQMILNGASQRSINEYVMQREMYTAKMLGFESSQWWQSYKNKQNQIISETGKNNREHTRHTIDFFGIPLGTRETIYQYDNNGQPSTSVGLYEWTK